MCILILSCRVMPRDFYPHTTGHFADESRELRKKNLILTMRVAFRMKLKPGFVQEYKRRHADIWPELKTLLRNSGVRNYVIFFDEESHVLFAVQDVDGTKSSQDLGSHEIVRRWWAYMADIMETNDDQSPVSIPLSEVFYLD